MTGEVVFLYAFDVGNEIVPAKVDRVLGRKAEPLDVRRDHTSPRAVTFHQPLAVEPEPACAIAGRPARTQVRVYDVGVVSVLFRVPVAADALAELVPFHRPTLADGRDLAAAAHEVCRQVVEDLGPTILKPAPVTDPEAYTVFCLADLGGPRDVPAWLAGQPAAVAGLLSDFDPDRLAPAQVSEVLRHQQSFERTDLVVVDWDAALVVDLSGYYDDVLFVLELANLQLEEFRVMDVTLDRHLTTAYALTEKRPGILIGGPSALLRQIRGLSVDVARLSDEVTHITKFLGDWYLARVYLSARERFHLVQWRTSVEERLDRLNDLYSVVRAEVGERRMLWLEIVIVVFFAIDLLAILVLKR